MGSVWWLLSVGCSFSRKLEPVEERKCAEKVRVRWSSGMPEEAAYELTVLVSV